MSQLKDKLNEIKTVIRLGLLLNLSNLLTPKDMPIDLGYAEATIDPKTGEYLRFVSREAGSELTIISERQEDGSWRRYAEY